RSEIDALERALPKASDFAREPMILVGLEEPVVGEYLRRIARRFEDDRSDVEFVGADIEDGIVELPREPQRPKLRPQLDHGLGGSRRRRVRRAQCDGRAPRRPLELDGYRAVL